MKKMANREKILNGNIRRILLVLSLPVILGNAIQTIYGVVDMYWVSKLAAGDLAVAAVNFVGPLIHTVMALGIGMNIAGVSMVSQFIGLGKEYEAKKVAGQLVTFSFLFSLVLAVAGLIFGKPLLIALGAEAEILEYGWAYLSIIFLGGPTMFVFFAFQSTKQGQGDTLTPMILAGSSVLLNIILDPIFMFVLDMGVAGAAWATVVSRALSTVAGLYLLFFTNNGLRLDFADLLIVPKLLLKTVKVGLPAGLGQSVTGLGFMIMNAFVLSFGEYTIAAFGIGNRINSMILMPAMGIGAALATVVGQNLGAGQTQRAVKAVKESILLSATILAVGGICMYFAAPSIVGIFSDNPVVLEQGIFYLRLITLSIPLMGIFQSFVGCFQGSGHTMMVMFYTSARLWALRIPLILLLKYLTALGEKSVWFAMVGSNFIICIIGLALFLHGRWKVPIVDEEEDYVGELEIA